MQQINELNEKLKSLDQQRKEITDRYPKSAPHSKEDAKALELIKNEYDTTEQNLGNALRKKFDSVKGSIPYSEGDFESDMKTNMQYAVEKLNELIK